MGGILWAFLLIEVSTLGGTLTYQNRSWRWEKATIDQPLLVEAVNSTEVFLPWKHKGCGEWEVGNPIHQGLTGTGQSTILNNY